MQRYVAIRCWRVLGAIGVIGATAVGAGFAQVVAVVDLAPQPAVVCTVATPGLAAGDQLFSTPDPTGQAAASGVLVSSGSSFETWARCAPKRCTPLIPCTCPDTVCGPRGSCIPVAASHLP